MITLRAAFTAHLCGVVMGMATVVGIVPGVVQMMRMLYP